MDREASEVQRADGGVIMSHKDNILKYMRENGSITQNDAFREFGCTRLAARIADLRKDGHVVVCEMETGPNRSGYITRYARYKLEVQS